MDEIYDSMPDEYAELESETSIRAPDYQHDDYNDYDCDDMMYNEGLCASCLYFNGNYCDSPAGICAYEEH